MRAAALAVTGAVLSLLFWLALAFAAERVNMALVQAGGRWAMWGGDVAVAALLGGLPVFAWLMRRWCVRVLFTSAPGWPVALTASTLSLLYWFVSLAVVYGLFAGDPAPGAAALPAGRVYLHELLAAAVLVLIYTFAPLLWRRARRR